MRHRRGFTLIEAAIALAVGLLLVGGILTLVRGQIRSVRRQSLAADLQQSLRIAVDEITRRARSAGRGGLEVTAIALEDNVPPGRRVGGRSAGAVAPESDILILRGVFDDPIYEIATSEVESPSSGRVHVRAVTSGGASQSLTALADRAADEVGGALLLAGPAASVGCVVVELTGHEIVAESAPGVPEQLALSYRATGSELAAGYAALCEPLLPIGTATRLGMLEEYRYYVRHDPEAAAELFRPRLARARFRPGSETPHPGSPAGGVDLVDHALDLQIALGADLDRDGAVEEAAVPDEWLWNDPGDAAGDPEWSKISPQWVRFTLLLRAARAEPGYLSPALDRIENRLFHETTSPTGDPEVRRFQRGRVEATVRRRG